MRLKKLTALLLAAVMLVLPGCGKTTSPYEYYIKINENVKLYTNSVGGVAQSSVSGSADMSYFDKIEEAFSNIEALSPPSGYEELHQKMCDGVKKQREYIALMKSNEEIKASGTANPVKTAENKRKMEEMEDELTFGDVWTEIVAKYIDEET